MMDKEELVIFVMANATIFICISIVSMISLIAFLVIKARKLNETMETIENSLKSYENKINSIDGSTLEYIKSFRKILLAHKGEKFDTKLISIIDYELERSLSKTNNDYLNNLFPGSHQKNEFPEKKSHEQLKEKAKKYNSVIRYNDKDASFMENTTTLNKLSVKTMAKIQRLNNNFSNFKDERKKDSIRKKNNKKNKFNIINGFKKNFHNYKPIDPKYMKNNFINKYSEIIDKSVDKPVEIVDNQVICSNTTEEIKYIKKVMDAQKNNCKIGAKKEQYLKYSDLRGAN